MRTQWRPLRASRINSAAVTSSAWRKTHPSIAASARFTRHGTGKTFTPALRRRLLCYYIWWSRITRLSINFPLPPGISSGCALRHPLARGPAKHRMQLSALRANWPFLSSSPYESKLSTDRKPKTAGRLRDQLRSFLRRVRDSNPRSLSAQQFSRLPPSTTRPTLQY